MAKKLGDYDCIHLVKTVSDPGTRLDVAPTMKRITVDGIQYTRTTTCRIEYEDGKVGVTYMSNLPAAQFMERTKPNAL